MNMTNKPTSRQPRPVRIANRVPIPRLKFRECRIAVAGTQRKMATDLGVTELTIQKLEQGKSDPSFLMCFVYAAYLGTSVYDLFPDIVDEAKSFLANRNIV